MNGNKFGFWTAIGETFRVKGAKYIKCNCKCGTVRNVAVYSLESGNSSSCGCATRNRVRPNDVVIDGDIAHIVLRNKHNEVVGLSKIDSIDLSRVRKHRWHLSTKGYVEARKDGKLIKLHNFISGNLISDHINRDKTDNRISNIRPATIAQNNRNRVSCGVSKVKGVWKCKITGRWCASIMYNGKRVWLGRHDTDIEAGVAYDEKAKEFMDEFLLLNEEVV